MNNPNDLMSRFQAAQGNGGIPGMPGYSGMPMSQPTNPMMAPYTPGLAYTQEQINSMIDERLKAFSTKMAEQGTPTNAGTEKLQAFVGQMDNLFQRALPEGDYKALGEYIQKGATGFNELAKSDKLYPIVQLMWETIKENAK